MTKTIRCAIALATAAILSPSPAAAQEQPKTYFNVNVGAQPQRRTIDAKATAPIFDEDAVFTTEQRVGNGLFADVAGGHRVKPNLMLGAAITFFSTDGDASGTAAIPDPLFVGHPTNIAVSLSDLKRSEQAVHLHAVWIRPLRDRIDVALSAGPSIIHVSQEFLAGTVGADQVVAIAAQKESGTGIGFNVGADLTYLVTSRYGVGLLVRYSWASVGLPAADVTAGGLQVGVGARVRF